MIFNAIGPANQCSAEIRRQIRESVDDNADRGYRRFASHLDSLVERALFMNLEDSDERKITVDVEPGVKIHIDFEAVS